MSTTEVELLQDYMATGSQAAFSALVDRHVDLIYSAAVRQVRSPQLAEEITQTAFVALARHAHQLKPGTPIVAWLYLVVRRAALDALRAESRRRTREQIALEMNALNSDSSDWPRVEPLLDEAMAALSERDRHVILWRFFEDKSLREIGAALGASEDAAQKRVSRALDRLRAFFSRRGVAVGAASLATTLSAHAVQAAPIGLGLSISSAAALAGAAAAGTTAVSAGAHLFVMTTIQKTVIGATLAVAVGVGVREYQLIGEQKAELAAARHELDALRPQLRQLQQERDAANQRWAALEREIGAAASRLAAESGGAPATRALAETEMKAVLDRAAELQRRVAELSNAKARASGLLKKEDWLKIALEHRLETDADVKAAIDEALEQVKIKWTEHVNTALTQFIKTSGGALPTDMAQLAPFLPSGIDASVLQRFEMLRTGNYDALPADAWLAADIGAVDDAGESLVMFGRGNTLISTDADNADRRAVLRAYADFVRTHNGQTPGDVMQLQPYLGTPVAPGLLQSFWKQHGHLLR
jgi:RNA polymerase sigma factor (sigma-70 family)